MLTFFVCEPQQVRHSKIQEGGRVVTDGLVELEYAVHRLAVEPGSPHTLYCCCEDSSVWRVCCLSSLLDLYLIPAAFLCC
jgi:hypothetical protein